METLASFKEVMKWGAVPDLDSNQHWLVRRLRRGSAVPPRQRRVGLWLRCARSL